MDLELKFAKLELSEENHLANVYNSKLYKGWYRYTLETEEDGKNFVDTIIRFRLPPAIPLYQDVLRTFTQEERLVGIHRFLRGKDLQEETAEMLKFEDVGEYVKTLSEDKVQDILGRMDSMVTLDCNRVPYLHIRTLPDASPNEQQVKDFILSQPDFLRIFYDVLNENISILEASNYSKNVVYNEAADLKGSRLHGIDN